MARLIDADELLKIYANRDNVLGVTLQPVGKSEGCKYVELDKIKQFPIRRNHYDRENGSEEFINGIESVMEYIEQLPMVELIQCKDCIYYAYHGHHSCSVWRERAVIVECNTAEDGFCYMGKRKEG